MTIKKIVIKIGKTILPLKLRRCLKSFWQDIKENILKRRIIVYSKSIIRRINQKRKNGQPINVLFLVQFPEMWNSEKSLYQALSNDKRFLPSILCLPKYSELNESGNLYYDDNEAKNYFDGIGVKSINAFERGSWKNMEELDPDYIFIQRPYSHQLPLPYRFQNLCQHGLLCYIPYSGRLTKGIHVDIELNAIFLKFFYMFFADCNESFSYVSDHVRKNHYEKHKKIYNIGFPRFDNVNNAAERDKSRNALRFLWLPRWSLSEHNDKSHFLDYVQPMLQYFEDRPEYELVIRPHPLMFMNFINEKAMSPKEVKALEKRIENISNVSFDGNADYLDSFKHTDILIADVTSLLLEFFFTKKPIIFCGEFKDLTNAGELIDQTFYKAKCFDDIVRAIDLIKNDDPQKKIRNENLKKMSIYTGNASENIKNALLKEAGY